MESDKTKMVYHIVYRSMLDFLTHVFSLPFLTIVITILLYYIYLAFVIEYVDVSDTEAQVDLERM